MLLQTYWDGRWHDAATLNFFGSGKDARIQIAYLPEKLTRMKLL